MKQKITQDITLAKRAGKLIMGFDVVKESLQNKTGKLLVISEDISPKTRKEVLFLANKYETDIVFVELTLDELWYLVGKKVGVMSINDDGFANKIKGYCLVTKPTKDDE